MKESEISITDIANIVVGLSNEYDAFFDIEGGEIFLREDILKLFDVLPYEYLNRITVTTNGTVKIPISSKIIKELDEFRVSVEGHTDELQRDIRGINLDPVMKTCETLKLAGVPPVLRITLHKKNFQHLEDMVPWFIEQGFDKFSLYEFQAIGRGLEHESEYVLNENDLVSVLEGMCDHSIVGRSKLFKISLNSRRLSLVQSIRNDLELAGFEVVDVQKPGRLTIDCDASLRVCSWDVDGEVIGSYEPSKFIYDVQELYNKGKLDHYCRYCSAIRIQAKSA